MLARHAGTPARFLLSAFVVALTAAGCADGVSEEVMRENVLGTAYLGRQNWTEAGAAFQRALELRPQDPVLLTNRAVALSQKGEIDSAVEYLRKALAVDPDQPYAHYNLGLIENRRGNFEPAAEHFAAVAVVDPTDLSTQYYLGSSLSRIGREAEGIEAYRAALALDPDHVSSLYGLGRTLLQQGDQEEGTRLVQRSQEVRARSGLDEAVGSQYGEQGPYALGVDYPADALAAPEAIEVDFDVLVAVPTGEVPPPWTRIIVSGGETALLVGGADALRRLSADGWTEIVDTRADAVRPIDSDNDGVLELVSLTLVPDAPALTLARPVEDGGWESSVFGSAELKTLGLPSSSWVDIAVVDRDHDGDMDLFLCWIGKTDDSGSGCAIGTNDGEGRFDLRSSTEHGFDLTGAGRGPIDVTFCDIDNDRDIDLIVAEPAGLHVFSNRRDGTFGDISESLGLGAAAGGSLAAVADLDKDGRMDLVVAGAEIVIWSNGRRGFEVADRFEIAENVTPTGVVFDFDNDGFLDLAHAEAGGVVLRRNEGRGNWAEHPQRIVPADTSAEGSASPMAAFDHDGDGDLDLAVWETTGDSANVVVYSNEGGNRNRWIRLDTTGVGDNRHGIGAKVEVLAGALRQKFEVIEPLPLHVGLGHRDSVQSARYLWPSGVLQDEIELTPGDVVEITQLDRKGTSCPLLYAWRDGGWRFVTDFLGGCAIGYQQAPGVFSVPDTDEYVRLDGGLAEDGEGRLRLRLNNQLEEVIWFDQVELVVVDHPVGTEVYPNERLMPGPPYPEFELYASDEIRPIASAKEVERNREVTERLRESDRSFADGFELLRPKGYAELHTLEIDLGPFPGARRVVLLLDGWIDYADSTANVAAHQAGLKLIPPRLHVADGHGGWVETSDRMGFPAGLPKTMAVELNGVFPSADHRLRIQTNMRIYWDRARVMLGGEETPLGVTRLAPLRAELRFGGFPRTILSEFGKPIAYDPQASRTDGGFKAHVGSYTGFGDVSDLLARIDDHFVTTKNGDEIELSFPSPGSLEPGNARTYLLYADGFGKDMDPNSAASNEVGPIPFHAMPHYPYGADVVPPMAGDGAVASSVPRRVLPSPDGTPGALPQPLVAEADHAD